jgi:hypothetical protein
MICTAVGSNADDGEAWWKRVIAGELAEVCDRPGEEAERCSKNS